MSPASQHPDEEYDGKQKPQPFTGSRVIKSATLHIDFPPAQVFPLLCPQRECDWLDGWDFTWIHSASGYAEQDCVFTTSLPQDGPTIGIFTSYLPDRHLEYVKVTPGFLLLRWSMDLVEPVTGSTSLDMTWTVTGMSRDGNRFVEESLDSRFNALMTRLEKSMNHYLKTGEKLVTAA